MYSGGNWSKIKPLLFEQPQPKHPCGFLCENAGLKVHVRTQEKKCGAELRGGSRAWSTTRVEKVVWRAQTAIQQFSSHGWDSTCVTAHTAGAQGGFVIQTETSGIWDIARKSVCVEMRLVVENRETEAAEVLQNT